MECLIIKERILGMYHSELLPSIRLVCKQGNLTDPSVLIAMYSRAVDIAQKSNLSVKIFKKYGIYCMKCTGGVIV